MMIDGRKDETLLVQMITSITEHPEQQSYHFHCADLMGEEEEQLARLSGAAISLNYHVPVTVTLTAVEVPA